MKKKKSQVAMEFLMTYGWAIFAALIVIGVVWWIIGNPVEPQPEFVIYEGKCEEINFTVENRDLVNCNVGFYSKGGFCDIDFLDIRQGETDISLRKCKMKKTDLLIYSKGLFQQQEVTPGCNSDFDGDILIYEEGIGAYVCYKFYELKNKEITLEFLNEKCKLKEVEECPKEECIVYSCFDNYLVEVKL